MLQWSTESERQNEGFEVERSENLLNWTGVSWVPGAGTSTRAQTYAYRDEDVLPGQTYYYRLRQRDFDGQYHTSKVIAAALPAATETTFERAYPSLVSGDTVYATVVSPTSQAVRVDVYAFHGARLYAREVRLDAGDNTLNIDVSGAAAGLYVVRLTLTSGQTLTRRFTKS